MLIYAHVRKFCLNISLYGFFPIFIYILLYLQFYLEVLLNLGNTHDSYDDQAPCPKHNLEFGEMVRWCDVWSKEV